MWNLFRKDFLTISRDRSEVLVLLAMPMILIAILGFALGNIMFGNMQVDPIPIALVIENDFEQDIEQFRASLVEEGMSEQAIEEIMLSAEAIDPEPSFQAVIDSPELRGLINHHQSHSQAEAEVALENEEVSAVITIPEQFTYETLLAFYFGEAKEATIELTVFDHEQLESGIIENIITSFIEQYNMELSIASLAEGEVVATAIDEENFGEVTYFTSNDPISAFQYYTIGMAMMFALYVASTISSNAYKEKSSQVFARLMITGQRPIRYLLSKAISGTILTLVQLFILFITSTLIFDTFPNADLQFWLSIVFLTVIYALVVGSLGTLLTAIAMQTNNDAISGVFSGGIVVIFAFIGGSMTPVEQISPFVFALGNWTPNGAMMSAYLQVIQGFGLSEVLPLIYRVLLMTVIFISVAVIIFPKRRLV